MRRLARRVASGFLRADGARAKGSLPVRQGVTVQRVASLLALGSGTVLTSGCHVVQVWATPGTLATLSSGGTGWVIQRELAASAVPSPVAAAPAPVVRSVPASAPVAVAPASAPASAAASAAARPVVAPASAPAQRKSHTVVTLLPDPKGHVGAVILHSAKGEVLLNKAFAGVEVSWDGAYHFRGDQSSGADGKVNNRAYQLMQTMHDGKVSVDTAPAEGQLEEVLSRYGSLLSSQAPQARSFVVRFASGSATTLNADSKAEIPTILRTVAGWQAPQIWVIGHTDRVGSPQANDELSRQRARTVARMLEGQGIAPDRIEVSGRGERDPLVSTKPGVANATNRRVEIVVY